MAFRSSPLNMLRKSARLGLLTRHVGRVIRALLVAFLAASLAPCGKGQDKQSGNVVPPGAAFAFSDFDGDRRPDLAVIQTGRSDRSFTDYWVELKLTAAGMQSIRVVGPTGGLQVAARDVNGDDVPDLVLTTSWRNQPVAILVNDGAGGFSRVDPNIFPGAFSSSDTNWSKPASKEEAQLVAPTQYRPGFSPAASRVPHLRACARFLPRGEVLSPSRDDGPAHVGRAPPTGLLFL